MPKIRYPYVGKQYGQAQDRPVNELPRLWKGTHHIKEQYGSNLIGFVYGNVLVSVIEQNNLTFFPVVLLATVDQGAFFVAGNNYPEVHTQNTRPRPFVWH
jgi:hypothetical protein